ncbi:ARM repeat-containing protein [Paramicrosporidium saccamoebae]|uniref:ARM repeat-containing protein n=1 Tax=Paramicrosporidium saccamoebae TaxID=1246581 RepID=A0A2H9THD0_9FUNG|nr:ARM repeat-containing protein [Paramicrosporidium saccamoebae]
MSEFDKGRPLNNPRLYIEERKKVLEDGQDEADRQAQDSRKSSRIADREDEYKQRRIRTVSPDRMDTLDSGASSYAEIMKERELEREKHELERKLYEKRREEPQSASSSAGPSKRRRWDMPTPDTSADEGGKIGRSEWDEAGVAATPRSKNRNRWDETPVAPTHVAETPRRAKTRWDETPVNVVASATPRRTDSNSSGSSLAFLPGSISVNPDQSLAMRWERELEARNRFMTDDELDSVLPSEGYSVLVPPASYVPVTPSRKLAATPAPGEEDGFRMHESLMSVSNASATFQPPDEDLPAIKPEDYQYFGKLMESKPDEQMTIEEAKERKILKLLLRIKNGTPQMRRQSLRQITEKARDFGASALFDQILPLLMAPALEDQERHLLVKVIDRVLFKLGDLVRPYVHKILVVIEPLLIEEDYYARVEGREIISNLSKAAGLATMIATLRPDIDHADEYVRNTTARTFAVVASALGIQSVVPFLKAVCRSKKSWQARHTGIKIIQQIAILLGCAVLPHLRNLVECVALGLDDEQHKIRTMSSLAVSALAEASAPYGIESFEPVLGPMWRGVRQLRGKSLAATLKAIGHIIALMDQEQASYYTQEVMPILIREFQAPDDEMKKIVLKVVKQCASKSGVQASYLRTEVLPDFFKYFWVRRMALDRRNARQLIETTVELANKVGVAEVIGRIVGNLKDESEPFRRMTVEAIDRILTKLSGADISGRLEEQLVDGILFTFQEQVSDDIANVVMNGFGSILKALGTRAKPYLVQISSLVLWRLSNRSAKIRQLAADLVSRVAPTMALCNEEGTLAKLSVVLYENLGEEYPDVLGSILGALKSIISVIGMSRMKPPIKDLLPRLTPILRNRHEKVQENCIELVGRIADRAAEAVNGREWMRICFELLDMLKAHRKSIRRAAINTFGYIAKAVGPHDVLAALLNNLKVQERQNRVCTTIAIAIVAETCAPFTVLPALMNEYRVPEMNVQNGVLKSLAFMFEYIGEMSKDYIYAVTPLLEDALIDRDQVHRQTAAMAVRNMALGVVGFGCEEALLHLVNSIIPNVFDANPHLITAVIESMDAVRLSVGPCTGLFHPARRVRDIYWKIYNNLYIASQDALISCFPKVLDEENAVYQRHVMNIEADVAGPSTAMKKELESKMVSVHELLDLIGEISKTTILTFEKLSITPGSQKKIRRKRARLCYRSRNKKSLHKQNEAKSVAVHNSNGYGEQSNANRTATVKPTNRNTCRNVRDAIIDIEGDAPDHFLDDEASISTSHILTPSFHEVAVPVVMPRLKPKECTNDEFYLKQHRPMEIAERRARKREAEVALYAEYITQLRRNSPELWSRKTT